MAYKFPVSEPIAIVGSSCRFAGRVTSTTTLWQLLKSPSDLSRRIPAERFNIDGFFHPDAEYHGTTNAPNAYFLDQDHRVFDANFFNITPKEAEAIDPQQRMLLECVYEALEAAGYTLGQYAGKNVAVFAGIMTADYDTLSQRDDIYTSQYYATGNARSIVSNRISYFFNFAGPSMTIDTACSSSLVALHQAVLSLRSGESEMACVTGANLILTPEQFIAESNLHMLSPTGHCRMWDAAADGYARGEGIAAMFIKPLSKAIADGDRIEAIIRETGVNSDGRSKGITMPNWKAQANLIQDTYHRAGLDPRTPGDRCQYFEAHGTGTAAGDPNEARAIEEAFFGRPDHRAGTSTETAVPRLGETPQSVPMLLVGSVKTVIGHTEGAAGLAGIMKVVQALRHDTVPPNLHLDKMNPVVEQYCTALFVPTQAMPWPRVADCQPKRASVNSFGFGGTNAHAIIEEFVPSLHVGVAKRFSPRLVIPQRPDSHECDHDARVNLPLLLSAASQGSLGAMAKTYRDYLDRGSPQRLEHLAWNSYAHRTALPFRVAVTGITVNALVSKLDKLVEQSAGCVGTPLGTRARPDNEKPRILGIFTGQGAQWATMSRGLINSSKVYGDAIRNLDAVLRSCPDPPTWSLEQELNAEGSLSRVHVAKISQPLCTAVQIALVDLLRSLGVDFHAVVGHSSGEIAAAYAAGRLCARDAMLISYYRGKFAHLAGGANGKKGGMLAAGLSCEEAAELCARTEYGSSMCMAASNAPSLVTLSGDIDVIKRAHEELKAANKFSRLLQVDTAYHSPHMEVPSKQYLEKLAACQIAPLPDGNGTTWISTVYGHGEPPASDIALSYWNANMLQPVFFREALESALDTAGPFSGAIEIGPHPSLQAPATQTIKAKIGECFPYSGVLDRTTDDRVAFSQFLGWMWTHFGSATDHIRRFVQGSVQPDLVNLRLEGTPSYTWDHSHHYWRESRVSRQYHFRTHAPHELLGVRARDDNDFEMRWRNILKLETIPWIEHHMFEGQSLLPASAYIVMAVDAARVALAGRPASVIELRDLAFLGGITLDKNDTQGVEVLFSLAIDRASDSVFDQSTIDGSFALTSAIPGDTSAMKRNFEGKFTISLGDPYPDILPNRPAERPETLRASPKAFYEMMAGRGLGYTGPFQGLTSLDRRFCFASGTVKKLHSEDTTKLKMSPATLDCYLQTAFVSLSSPGDGAIWTSFLPEAIDAIRVNLAICDSQTGDEISVVDTYLTKATPYTQRQKASFTADVQVYDNDGNMEIQVQGLTVASWSPTKPEEDYELYLTSVFDLDPEDAIVAVKTPEDPLPNSILIESCERVASYYHKTNPPHSSRLLRRLEAVKYSQHPVPASHWPAETDQSLDDFIRRSPYYSALDFIRQLGRKLPDLLPAVLPTVVIETHELIAYQHHVSRVVRQIAHKYPRMNVVGLTRAETGLSEHVLAGLGDSFSSYVIGGESEKNMEDHVLGALPNKRSKIIINELNFDGNLSYSVPMTDIDLVLLDVSFLEGRDIEVALQKIRDIMRLGGFLILLQIPRTSLRDRLRGFAGMGRDQEAAHTQSLSEWTEILQRSGFLTSIANSQQEVRPGFNILVSQANSIEKQLLNHPHRYPEEIPHFTDRLLIIGSKEKWVSQIAARVQDCLSPQCGTVAVVDGLDDAEHVQLLSCTAVVFLSDICEPILSNLTKIGLEHLQLLLRPHMTLLWVTHNARYSNPDNAASFGFTRTVAAETPGIALQMLDLDRLDILPAADIISETFLRLAVRSLVHGSSDSPILWVHEPEVYLEDSRRHVPRIKPWKEGIERVNAGRRVVASLVNTLETCVAISSYEQNNGDNGHQSIVQEIRLQDLPELEKSRVLQVDYSTAEAIRFSSTHPKVHVCLGREVSTQSCIITLSSTNSSYISQDCTFTAEVPCSVQSQPLFLMLVVGYVAAFSIDTARRSRPILFLDPDPALEECVRDVFCRRGIAFRIFCTDRTRCKRTPGMVFIHSNLTVREIRSWCPAGASIFNFLPGTHPVSQTLAKTPPRNCEFLTMESLFEFVVRDRPGINDLLQSIWTEAVETAISKSLSLASSCHAVTLSPAQLLNRTEPAKIFEIIDWRADRWMQHIIQPCSTPKVLDSRKTYVLVGLTRDLGQSLCTLFVNEGARNIVLASRNPPVPAPLWQQELLNQGYNICFEPLDVTDLQQVRDFKEKLAQTCPPVGGVVNGAMVLDDRVFSQMSLETFHRVMGPKTIGSKNLDITFGSEDLDFFIMMSSFAAVGGHAGQANYAAANMYMNGLAATRRSQGKAASVLNIGVIYGLGLLHREKENLYEGLSREGYPPISERDVHHMFMEAIAAGKPAPNQILDIITGLRRFPANHPTLSWHRDPRFSHFSYDEDVDDMESISGSDKKTLKELVVAAGTREEIVTVILSGLTSQLQRLLHIPAGRITGDDNIAELGVDSLVAVEIRAWFWKSVGQDVPVMKVMGVSSIFKLAQDIAAGILESRNVSMQAAESMIMAGGLIESLNSVTSSEDGVASGTSSAVTSTVPTPDAPRSPKVVT